MCIRDSLDAAVGRLADAAGGDVTVGVVSDHGFGGAGTGVVHLNNWLAARGYLAFSGGGRSFLKRAGLTLAPASWRGTLFRRLRGLASRAESASRFGGIDWARTTAWSEELNYFPSIRVNLRGREPLGRVEATTYRAFCERLCAELRARMPELLRETDALLDAANQDDVVVGDRVAVVGPLDADCEAEPERGGFVPFAAERDGRKRDAHGDRRNHGCLLDECAHVDPP